MKKIILFLFTFIPIVCLGQVSRKASVSATIMVPQAIEKDSSGNILISGQKDQIYSMSVCDSIFLGNDSSIIITKNYKKVHTEKTEIFLRKNTITRGKKIVNIIYE